MAEQNLEQTDPFSRYIHSVSVEVYENSLGRHLISISQPDPQEEPENKIALDPEQVPIIIRWLEEAKAKADELNAG